MTRAEFVETSAWWDSLPSPTLADNMEMTKVLIIWFDQIITVNEAKERNEKRKN